MSHLQTSIVDNVTHLLFSPIFILHILVYIYWGDQYPRHPLHRGYFSLLRRLWPLPCLASEQELREICRKTWHIDLASRNLCSLCCSCLLCPQTFLHKLCPQVHLRLLFVHPSCSLTLPELINKVHAVFTHRPNSFCPEPLSWSS